MHRPSSIAAVAITLVCVGSVCLLPALPAGAQATPDVPSLRAQIEEKARALKELEARREAVEKNLEEVRGSSDSLKNELRLIDATVNQLHLSIRANEVTLEKLSLEYDELGEEMVNAEQGIENAKETIGKLFTELQQRDHENLFTLFFRSSSLSGGVAEMQSLTSLQNQLVQNIERFRNLQKDLAERRILTEENRARRKIELINLASRQQIVKDQKQEKQTLLSITKSQEDIYQQQLDDLKALQAEISKEIEQFESELRRTIDENLLPLARPGVLLWPVNGGRVTQCYGRTPFAIRNYGSQWHNGVDIGAPVGTEIFSAADGAVINVGDQDRYRGCRNAGYGKFIVVKHTNGLTTLYAHLSGIIVSVGQKVGKGEVIGYLGHTGWATGPHLHFAVLASQTLTPARGNLPEGTVASRSCGPMPVGGDINPKLYVDDLYVDVAKACAKY